MACVMEAYVNGVSTRKVDRLVEQLGIHGMSKDRVSSICLELDECVDAFRERPLEGEFPYLWLDAKHLKIRDRGHVRSKALVVAYAVHETGHREVIGIDIGETETEAFWLEFLRGLRSRGLHGIRLAVSDQHEGPKTAIERILACPWQRCTVHFVRNMQGHCRRTERGLVSAALREIFDATGLQAAKARLGDVLERFQDPLPKIAELLETAEEDLLAFYHFPAAHWPKLRSTNPLERVNREIGRRTDAVGIFPNDASALRLAGALLIEQNDEWLVNRRYLSAETRTAVCLLRGGTKGRADTMSVRNPKEAPMELAIVLILLLWVAPIAVIMSVAGSRNRSRHYGWWGFALGWLGAIIALILILVQREKPPSESTRTSSTERFQ